MLLWDLRLKVRIPNPMEAISIPALTKRIGRHRKKQIMRDVLPPVISLWNVAYMFSLYNCWTVKLTRLNLASTDDNTLQANLIALAQSPLSGNAHVPTRGPHGG